MVLKYLLVFMTLASPLLGSEVDSDPGEPLYLTPLIKAGNVGEALKAALNSDFHPVLSYSGFITVNEEHNSNIFFWFFPAEESYENFYDNDIPVILWNDGGPGISLMFSVFGYNGPYQGNEAGDNYTKNDLSWHKKYHMIFMDNPVGVGFSFTDKGEGYVTSAPEAARDIYTFLKQFFAMFPHLRRNPFYNAGPSYGATYAIQTAHLIHKENLGEPELHINLTGLIIDSPSIDMALQSQYGDPLYTFGLISENDKKLMTEMEDHIRTLVAEQKHAEAKEVWTELTQTIAPNLTGYSALYGAYDDEFVIGRTNMTELVIRNSTRKGLHVGNKDFIYVNMDQMERMSSHFMKSSSSELDTLLKAGYRFMVYVGNMDILTGHLGVEKIVKSMEWEGSNQLINGTKKIHKEGNKIVSYVTNVNEDVEYVIFRNSGHGCVLHQPAWVWESVNKFIQKSRKTYSK